MSLYKRVAIHSGGALDSSGDPILICAGDSAAVVYSLLVTFLSSQIRQV